MASEKSSAKMIASLEAEVAALRLQVEQGAAAARVRDAVVDAMLIKEVTAPATHSRLLEMIVETAASVISARAGALFLLDEDADDLVCEAAIGGSSERVEQLRVPLGHGIAGGVALSGVALAISEPSRDSRWASDIGAAVGYVPDSIVCVPLFHRDRVIGSLELLDKEGAPSFTHADLNLLSLFAQQAAVTIAQSRIQLDLGALLAGALGEGIDGDLAEQLRRLGESVDRDPRFRIAVELGSLVREIAEAGER